MNASRPVLETDEASTRAGEAAVKSLVAELQAGLERHDADRYDARFGDNVLWGSPFGATVRGYERLHAIHVQFQAEGVAASSRFEVENVLVPAPDVAVAQVRRVSTRSAAEPSIANGVPNAGSFSEMALYVLVRRDGEWWLAAGQNTPIRPQEGGGT
ncbi:MAG TPA: SgcJ/EcaC family oxidoreductase [Polyangiaceae bacterium]|jgi:uncharacterized protein (TIGR02246 family)